MVLKNVEVWLLLLCSGYAFAQDVIVQIPDGQLRGRTLSTHEGTPYYQFLGIPFGQPPVNQLRFQAPRPALPWGGIRDATFERSPCFQIQYNYPTENEDCLYINVHTPRNPATNPNLPVMVWFYGGGFIDGWSDLTYFGPQHFMEEDVMVVTFNYRVGPFGFFSTGDDAIPGNAGLKDQNLALQWVQKNIQYFGGDPQKVTIFGESAGAASVGYQLLSPKSAGLFRAAIAESASPLSPWAYQRNQRAFTYETAGFIDASTAGLDSYGLLRFLQNVPAQQLKQAAIAKKNTENTENQQLKDGFFYAPVIEHEHADAFLTKYMYEALESGDFNRVPLLIGMNSGETVFYADVQANLDYMALVYDQNHTLLNPLDLHVRDVTTQRNAAEAIRNIYTQGGSFQANPQLVVSYMNDQCFMRSIIKHAELQSAYTDVYFYQFSYSGVLAGHTQQSVEGFTDQVRHAEELDYLFVHTYSDHDTSDLSKYPLSDGVVLHRFVRFFTNFAKSLNPTPRAEPLLGNIIWPKVTQSFFQYLDIGSYSEIRSNPRQDTYRAWDPIYIQYGQRPFDTY